MRLADPTLELHDRDGVLIASNDNWRSDQEAEIIASTVPPTNDLESAIVATLPPAAHTAIVRGKNGTTGVALVEVYALNQLGSDGVVAVGNGPRNLAAGRPTSDERPDGLP